MLKAEGFMKGTDMFKLFNMSLFNARLFTCVKRVIMSLLFKIFLYVTGPEDLYKFLSAP